MDKKILFLINYGWQKEVNIGDLFILMNVCHCKGLDMGYKEENIYLEWPIRVRFFTDGEKRNNLQCPKDKFIPINFIDRVNVVYEDYDKIINFNQPNCLYEGCKTIYDNPKPPLGSRHYKPQINYLNIHYINTGEKPHFDIEKDNNVSYILFHFRNVIGASNRNTNPKTFKYIFDIIKERYGNKYELWKCGEQFRFLDRKFDRILPYFSNLNDFMRLINNSSLFIGADSSPISTVAILGVPSIRYECITLGKRDRHSWHTKEYWKENGGIGESMYDWEMPERYIKLWDNEDINKDKLLEFADKWLTKK